MGGLTTELLLGGLTLRLLRVALLTIWLSLKSETQSPQLLACEPELMIVDPLP